LTLTTKNVAGVELSLDGRLVQFDRPLRVTIDGKAKEVAIRPSLATLCRSIAGRGDPDLACTCRVTVATAVP
jgi:hypothetical protein